MIASFRDVVLDATEPAVVGAFWGAMLGREVEIDADGDVTLRPGADGGPSVTVLRVPEVKTVKNRLHLDVTLEVGQEITDLLALGASVVAEPDVKPWFVLADPEGNEFCAFPPDSDASNDADAEASS